MRKIPLFLLLCALVLGCRGGPSGTVKAAVTVTPQISARDIAEIKQTLTTIQETTQINQTYNALDSERRKLEETQARETARERKKVYACVVGLLLLMIRLDNPTRRGSLASTVLLIAAIGLVAGPWVLDMFIP